MSWCAPFTIYGGCTTDKHDAESFNSVNCPTRNVDDFVMVKDGIGKHHVWPEGGVVFVIPVSEVEGYVVLFKALLNLFEKVASSLPSRPVAKVTTLPDLVCVKAGSMVDGIDGVTSVGVPVTSY